MPDNSYQYIPLATMKEVMKMYVEDILMVMYYINKTTIFDKYFYAATPCFPLKHTRNQSIEHRAENTKNDKNYQRYAIVHSQSQILFSYINLLNCNNEPLNNYSILTTFF